jgi:hypothetical protein
VLVVVVVVVIVMAGINPRLPSAALNSGRLARDYEINLDRRFSTEYTNPENRFICKTGTEHSIRQGQLIF